MDTPTKPRWYRVPVLILVGLLLLFIVLEGTALLANQRVEKKRYELALGGARTKTERRVPGWLEAVAGPDCHSFMDHTVISEVIMEGPEVDDADLARLVGLDHLRSLHLSRANITNDGLQHLSGLSGLRQLVLEFTPINDLQPLSSLHQLETLNLEHTKVPEDRLSILAEFPRMKHLSLAYVGITDAGAAHVLNCPELEGLALNGAKLSAEGLTQLGELKKLKQLVLVNAECDGAGLNAFKTAVPDCRVQM